MRKIKLYINTGYAGANHEETIEVEDDLTDEDLNGIVDDYVNNHIESGYYEVDENEDD